jgi:hypothetical protein
MRLARPVCLLVLLVLSGCASSAPEESGPRKIHAVTVTRDSPNVYRVQGSDVLLFTRGCRQEASQRAATLSMWGASRGELAFSASAPSCTVRRTFGVADMEEGTYPAKVSRRGSDWYEVLGANRYLRTSDCWFMASSQDVTVTLYAGGTGGWLVFPAGVRCGVRAVYEPLVL